MRQFILNQNFCQKNGFEMRFYVHFFKQQIMITNSNCLHYYFFIYNVHNVTKKKVHLKLKIKAKLLIKKLYISQLKSSENNVIIG